jgi:hypothetical protein
LREAGHAEHHQGPGGLTVNVLRWINAGLAFLLELAVLAALAYWGFTVGPSTPVKIALGVGAPVLAAVAWGLFAAPKARFTLPPAGVLTVKVLVFGAATAALYAAGRHPLAAIFAVLVTINLMVGALIGAPRAA